ncbi:glycogen debranching N-terminal domain-containing protein [Micromonospora sp. 4G55]|uniref:amylo-alpha-1,6-glucosidase n=1 Tax=Micromonospora sp. 4G55 TaxID=2806102 RepID=UPI001A5F6F0E|nr:glycogen debranching N-terminal domain-containing protein [Micromonospora sp. 4G55]MBM0256403.1 glycogen debranching protein [Micromonospora sp. 4G55]
MPGATRPDEVPSEVVRNLPPELGPNAIAVVEGRTFMYSNAVGDVPPNSIGGLVHADTRFLDQWELRLNGKPLLVLGSDTADYYSAAFFLTNPVTPGLDANIIGIRRQRFVGDGLYERVELQSFSREPLSVELRLLASTDFADLFEIKESPRDRSAQIVREHDASSRELKFSYQRGDFKVTTEVKTDPSATRVEGDSLVWDLHLERRGVWRCEFSVPLHTDITGLRPIHRGFGEAFDEAAREEAERRSRANVPVLESGSDLLLQVQNQTVRDMISLRLHRLAEQPTVLHSAGLPWFLSIFGRDTLITAYQLISWRQLQSRGTLLTLASLQGRQVDDFRDEEPGKILHEIRSGELTRLGLKPHNPYYGTADATQLWLILLSEHWRWTHDEEFVHQLRDNAYAALNWIDQYGDLDNDGYVEYATRSPQGLGNHSWRDSWDGIQFSDGTIPFLPIATCEIQGYTYDAKLRFAELAAGPYNDPQLAEKLREQAHDLRERFNRDFWTNSRGGYYVVGLDGDKQQIDSMTSNMGHLLWSGIVPPERASIIARHLMADYMFSGWGVRTTSTLEEAYNPIGYHMGTVWPHDNSIIAHGLARYGYRQEANRIILAMLDVARHNNFRLPEAISGYDRSFGRVPVRYPTACSPQAWASAAAALFKRTMVGHDVKDGQLVIDPNIPDQIGYINFIGMHAFGKRWRIEAAGTTGQVWLMP